MCGKQGAEIRVDTGPQTGIAQRKKVASVKVVALYRAELLWRDQKSRWEEYQKQVNRQRRTVTGMFGSTPKMTVVRE